MIADDKKKLIEAEEIYRHEFKKTLETTDTSISKTLDQVVSEVKLEKSKMGAQSSLKMARRKLLIPPISHK